MLFRSEKDAATVIDKLAGIHLQDSKEGVRVVAMDADSMAKATGLRVDDIIIAANRKSIRTISDLRHVLTNSQNDNILLHIIRNNSRLFVIVR